MIAAALATFQHHSSRGQRKARAGEEENETKYTAKFRTTPPPQPELFQLFEEEPGGLRPTGLVEPRGPQERIQRHTAEQMIGSFVPVPVLDLDAPVPQMVDQLMDMLKLFDNSVPEQVIDVPKFSQDAIPQPTVLCEPQLAEQLVEVPTVPFFVEQAVDIPVPRTVLFIASDGHEWCRIAGCISGGLAPFTPSGDPGRDTPPAQGGIQIRSRGQPVATFVNKSDVNSMTEVMNVNSNARIVG